MKSILTAIALILMQFSNAQNIVNDATKKNKPINPQNNKWVVQAHIGSTGFGAAVLKQVSKKIKLKAAYNTISVKDISNIAEVKAIKSTNLSGINLNVVEGLFYYQPFKSDKFNAVFGAGYFFNSKGYFTVNSTDNYQFGDIPITSATVGSTTMQGDFAGLAPYIGLSFFRVIPKKSFNVSVDIGIFYLSEPKGSIYGNGLLQGNSINEAAFQKNLNTYRWLPKVEINFNIKL